MGKRVVVNAAAAAETHDHHQHVTPVTTGQRNIRKRKCNSNITNSKNLRLNASSHNNNNYWHENDDEDSSSNDGPLPLIATTPRNASSKQANNSSILLNNSLNLSLTHDNNSSITESPKPVYTLRPSVVNGTIMYDLTQKPWRLGRPIGKGNFGEIFLASDNIRIPVTNENAKFVVKIEPHSNGPLFVEIHCLMNTAKKNYTVKDEKTSDEHDTDTGASAACSNLPKGEPSGIPDYIASGSHYFGNARYRFLVLPRFDRDLHSLIKKSRVHKKSVLTLAIHIINVLENLHDKGYCHNDVKAQNLMISKCKYLTQQKKSTTISSTNNNTTIFTKSEKEKRNIKSSSAKTKYDDHYDEKQQTTDSGNSSEQEANDDDDDDEDFVVKRKVYNSKDIDYDYEQDDESPAEEDEEDDEDDEDEDFDDGATTNSMNSNSMDTYHTPLNKTKRSLKEKKSTRNIVQYSGSNPVRSCRREKTNTIYDEMVKSHYLRPTKRISYLEFFNEDGMSVQSHDEHDDNSNSSSDMHSNSSDDDSEEFVPLSLSRSIKSTAKKSYTTNLGSRRLTRRQEKLLGINNKTAANNHHSNEHNKLKTERNQQLQQKEQEQQHPAAPEWFEVNEERIFLIDYGLASKFIDNGVHRPFVMDQRRAHDGTLEFTSRDAHMGAHSRRSDMECLGYNLLFWSQGYLPWKEAASNQQQEKVHRAKEFLMTDVRELLRQIYGKQVPKYLGEYLHLVGQLAYHERPDYARYRNLFEREYQQLGYALDDLHLNMHEIQTTCVRVKEEIENKNDFFETNKNNGVCNMVLNIMQNLSVGGTPFHERTLSNRVSPKNLRSKSDKKDMKKKKFSWTEILSQDPDQIARERAEKEFDREEELSEVQQPMVRRYQGKPTSAILCVLALLGKSSREYEEETARLEREYKIKHTYKVEKMEVDECDNVKTNDNETEDMIEDAEEEEDEDYREEQSGEENETDNTESSEHKITNKQRKLTKRTKTNKSTSKASRKLILKTPSTQAQVNKSETPTATPVCARTRGKRAATTMKKTTVSKTKTKTAKSTKKRGSAIKTAGRSKPSSATNGCTAASAAGEIEHNGVVANKRERRTRRCLIKTDLATSESLQDDDSNSNFSPDIWKMNNEAMYLRNCKK